MAFYTAASADSKYREARRLSHTLSGVFSQECFAM
jgi:hypothetical protein